ncbi:MAG: glycoside hydrolase family 2 protein, partial [Bacteroides sp.]
MMKRIIGGLLCCCSMVYGQNRSEAVTLTLNDHWLFSQAGTEKWLSAKVPGTVHQDLIHHQLLPDPFYGVNEEKIQWVENEDWQYKTSFTVSEELLSREG